MMVYFWNNQAIKLLKTEEMKPKIYYIVESLFYRKDIGNKLDFLLSNGDLKDSIHHLKREFKDESPIIARESAFNYFQSMVDVLYDGLGAKYTTDEQARIDLQKYFNSGNDVELMGNSQNKFKISDDLFNGLNIYMIVDEPITDKKKKKNKMLIHGINYIDYPERVDEEITDSIKGLIKECKYYEKYSYSTKGYFSFVVLDRIGGRVESILKTPFDLESFMTKHEGKTLI